MYELTLTYNERAAIDWIGYRYFNGNDLKELLCCDDCIQKTGNWDDKQDITFYIPEFLAWQIAERASEEDGDYPYNFPCFNAELTSKMINFCLNIV